ncbi:TetR/AcrR family transcriptional regulator [Streptomyces tsukubensis]|nr:TetR/AcrR family transcriptional regulator [Streptomyces tsukubensis]
MTTESLRERGKARRRAAITRAAFELFAERGFGATTIADVAAAAEVSPRTVTLYFRSKQDIAFATFDASLLSLTEALRSRAPEESAVEALTQWLRGRMACDDELDALGHLMFEANPELRAVRTSRMADAMREGAQAIAADLGESPEGFGPRLATAAAAAVVTELFESPPDTDPEEALAKAMAFLSGGMAAIAGRES